MKAKKRESLQNDLPETFISFIETDFKVHFDQIFEKNSQNRFLIFVDSKNQTTLFSREKFKVMTEKNILFLTQNKINLVVTKTKNNPETLALITAALILKTKVFPQNPELLEAETLSLIDEIGLKTFVYTSLKNQIIEASPKKNLNALTETTFFILTSGSTGRSKIVCQSIKNVLANARSLIDLHQLNENKTILTCLPTFHVNALHFAFICSLLSGAQLILFENYQPDSIFKAINSYKPQILNLVPSLLNSFTEWALHHQIQELPGVEYIVTAAAPLSKEVYLKARQAFNCKVIQGFGLSEAVNFSALMSPQLLASEIDSLMLTEDRTSIGQALNCNDLFILDEKNKIVLEGEVGEIALRGVNLMLGYLNSDENSDFPSDYLKTGDLGYYKIDQGGQKNFYIRSRLKEIIKKNGLTISLVDIDEHAAAFLLLNEQAIAVAFESDLVGEDLALVFNSQVSKERALQIKKNMNESLPDFKKPTIYLISSKNIRSSSGKALRHQFQKTFKAYTDQPLPKDGLLILEPID